MRALVLGAGGLGSYIGAVLARSGRDVTLLARGEHARSVSASGLSVVTPEERYSVSIPCVSDVADGEWDIVFVAVKAFSLNELAEDLVHVARSGTLVVPLLNGVSASRRLVEQGVPADQLVDGLAYVTAFRLSPGTIERSGAHQRLLFGSSTGASRSAAEQVAEWFTEGPIHAQVLDDIRPSQWEKMAVVCAVTVVCVLGGGSMGAARNSGDGRAFQREAIREVAAVARASGVSLPPDVGERVGGVLDSFPDDFYPSVVHDLRHERRTEIDELCGEIVRLGREFGVPIPLHLATTEQVLATAEGSGAPGF